MKIAHAVTILPGRSGLYETAREIAAALRAIDHDARMVPTTSPLNPTITIPEAALGIVDPKTFEPAELVEDRGVPSAPEEWLAEVDVVLNHEWFDEQQRVLCPDTPVVQMLHGAPEYCFKLENSGAFGGIRAYSSIHAISQGSNADQWAAFVTMWPQHVPYWEVIIPPDKLHCIQSCVDLEYWDPAKVEPDYDWGGTPGEINVVCTSSWRPGNVDIYEVVTAFYHFAKALADGTKRPGCYCKGPAKLHIYGGKDKLNLPSEAWEVLARRLTECDMLGEMPGWVGTERMRSIYRTADVMITPHHVATRGLREAMAMGCPVVAIMDDAFRAVGSFPSQPSPGSIMNNITAAVETRFMYRGVDRRDACALFNPAVTAAQLVEIIEGVLDKGGKT